MTIKQIEEALEEGQSLKAISQAYSEIANLKIKRIRSAVEKNRLFFDEISKVYSLVKAFALKKGVTRVKPKKRLCMLITSNYRFYGNINSSLIKYFVGSTRELADVDKLIIGKAGIEFFRTSKLLPNYQEIALKEDMPSNSELLNLTVLSSEYNQVFVFHSEFKSLLVQAATFTDLTKTKPFDPKHKDDFLHFIFEPELPKILNFFDNQILTLLLEQTFLESELSRTASRFISMDEAESTSIKFIKEYEQLKSYAKRNLLNNKILENFAAQVATRLL